MPGIKGLRIITVSGLTIIRGSRFDKVIGEENCDGFKQPSTLDRSRINGNYRDLPCHRCCRNILGL